MLTTVLSIISVLIGIIGGVLERRYTPDAIKDREAQERDKEIANKNHIAKSKRLSDLVDD
jgi:hypothetical protein